MAPTLYMIPASPPVRAVQILAKHLNLVLNLKVVDLAKGENLTPEFLKLNPVHTLPVLIDNDGTTIWDSHAILVYLLKKYGEKKQQAALYPEDAKNQALIHQIMHFESTMLFGQMKPIFGKLAHHGSAITLQDAATMCEAFENLNTILAGRRYAIGDILTIADYSLISSVTSILVIIDSIEIKKYPNVVSWMKAVKALPAYEANMAGLKVLQEIAKKLKLTAIIY